MYSFNLYLSRKRKKIGQSVASLAQKGGIDSKKLANIEQGLILPPSDLSAIYAAYDIVTEEEKKYLKTLAAFSRKTFPEDMLLRPKYFELLYLLDELLATNSDIDFLIMTLKERKNGKKRDESRD